MKKTIIQIKKMDCPSEVKMIEGILDKLDLNIKVDFDLGNRTATFYHEVNTKVILEALDQIALPGTLVTSDEISKDDIPDIGPSVEAKTLKYLLAINFTMFIVEILLGVYAESTGLIADGLDMLADSFVYAISLYAVGKSLIVKNRTAFLSGVMQISLGLLCLLEVGRKFYFGSEPLSNFMIIVSIVALIANVWCLVLIHKHKDGEVHMKASWIFSANDVIVNTGVIISGILVYVVNSNIPDLIIGALVSLIVINGGGTIIKLSKTKTQNPTKDNSCCNNNCS
jgi:Co/Zn/Cd efflux system component